MGRREMEAWERQARRRASWSDPPVPWASLPRAPPYPPPEGARLLPRRSRLRSPGSSPPRSPWRPPSWWWRLLRHWRLRLKLWVLNQGLRLPPEPLDEILVLRLLVLALTAIVLVETLVLLVSACVPPLLSVG